MTGVRDALHALADALADSLEQQTVANAIEESDVCPTPTDGGLREPTNDYVTLEQYARHRGVGRTTVFTWIRSGLPSVKQGGTRRIRVRDADAFLDAGRLAKHRPRTDKRRPAG